MDKIILSDSKNTNVEFNSIYNNGDGLVIVFANQTIENLETIMTKDNLTRLQIANSNIEVYGVYNNLECTSITKNLNDSTIIINLSKLDDTKVQLEELQKTVDNLVATTLEG